MRSNLWSFVLVLLFVLSLLVVAIPDIRLLKPGEGDFVREGFRMGLDLQGGTRLVLEADLAQIGEESPDNAMKGAMRVIQDRVNAYGVSEAVIQRKGEKELIVELPGVKNLDEAVNLIGQTAQMEFMEPKRDDSGKVVRNEKNEVAEWLPAKGLLDGKEVALTGSFLKRNNQVVLDPNTNRPIVRFEWDKDGGQLFEQITSRLLELPLGIFLDGRLIANPTVQAVIKESGIIEGLSLDEARLLAIQLNAGALPVPLEVVRPKSIGPSLGKDSLQKSLTAGELGFILVLLFMVAYYRFSGVVAGLSLLYYGFLVLAIFKLFPVTLTLAGIAGFIVSLGMAVDANVLVFERMKEELRQGRTLRAAVDRGFHRAWAAVRDSNITTFIACIVLYWFGSRADEPAIMGFAITLFIGVAVSMFSAMVVTRSLLRLVLTTSLRQRASWFKV